jgi:hypothetical protein
MECLVKNVQRKEKSPPNCTLIAMTAMAGWLFRSENDSARSSATPPASSSRGVSNRSRSSTSIHIRVYKRRILLRILLIADQNTA